VVVGPDDEDDDAPNRPSQGEEERLARMGAAVKTLLEVSRYTHFLPTWMDDPEW